MLHSIESQVNHPTNRIFDAFLTFHPDVERNCFHAENNRRFARIVLWGLSTRLFITGYALRMRQVYAHAANESTRNLHKVIEFLEV